MTRPDSGASAGHNAATAAAIAPPKRKSPIYDDAATGPAPAEAPEVVSFSTSGDRHFAITGQSEDAGFGFPGEPPTSYLDFAYLAFTIGATFQVSDNTVGSTKLRNLVTAHALAAYLYNTAILAVGISLLAGVLATFAGLMVGRTAR